MTQREEAECTLKISGGDLLQAMRTLEVQLIALHTRSQGLMSLAGVVITVTGFSGRNIAGTNLFGQISIILGLTVVLTSAVWVQLKVLRVRWITQDLCEPTPVDTLEAIIRRRDRKTEAYNIGGMILSCGFAIYIIAISTMLLYPSAG